MQNTPNEIEGTQNHPNDNYYPVEKLVKAKLISGKKHFLVKQVGNYSDSWEPEENIPEQVKQEFYILQANRKKRKRKKKTNTC